jgi:WD40 repeat protein
VIGLVGCNGDSPPATTDPGSPNAEQTAPSQVVGAPLYTVEPSKTEAPAPNPGPRVDPVVIHGCRLGVYDKRDLASPRDGILLFVGTELKPGEKEKLPKDRIITVKEGDKETSYRILKEDDEVSDGMLLGRLDDRVARDEYIAKTGKVTMADAEYKTAVSTRDEALVRWKRLERLGPGGAAAKEEIDERRLAYEKYLNDVTSKKEAINQAKLEANQALTILRLHEIHSPVAGVIKTVYRHPGEALKNLDPVLQVYDLTKLRAEGLIDVQYLGKLHKGMKALVEPSLIDPPERTLIGHFQDVNAVAVSKDAELIVSAGEDNTVRVWDRKDRQKVTILQHPTAVKAVACTPPGSAANLCLSGCQDGKGRLWDLDTKALQPVRELKGEHKGPITAVAFTPDGKYCATGGEDREIQLWDVATGELKYRFPAGHRAAVTSLAFTPQSQLVSAGKDGTVRLWTVGQTGARQERSFPSRSGDVTSLGVSPDGKEVLYDQGRDLRILSLPDGATRGVLQNPSAAANFNTFAQFSPDGRLIITTGGTPGAVQLWRTPSDTNRGREVRQLVSNDHSPVTCAAFSPDGSFIVTGTQNRHVMIWHTPTKAETDKRYEAEITLVDPTVEANAHQVRIWADMANPNLQLRPGTTVTLVIDPDQK